MSTDFMPWWLYRLRVRFRLWRHSGQWLNQRETVRKALLDGAKTGCGVSAATCRELARALEGGL